MRAGANIAGEPLHEKYNPYVQSLGYNPEQVPNLNDEEKIRIVDNTLNKFDLCKVLYYQVNKNIVLNLRQKYKLLLLIRNPFEVAISFRLAKILGRYHTNGEIIEPPETKTLLDKQEFINLVKAIDTQNKYYLNMCDYVFTYEEVNNWDNFVSRFSPIIGFNKEVKQAVQKNMEDPKDFIENYEELKNECIELQLYQRLV